MAVKPTYEELEQRVRELESVLPNDHELLIKSRLLDAATDSIFLFDLEGNIVYANETAYKSRGYTREELMCLKLGQLNTPEYAKLIGPRMKKLMETGECMIEAEHFRKDGSIMPIEVHARIIESGGKKLILAIARDITERKRAEADYKNIIKTAFDGFWLVDARGRFLDVNDSYCRMSGYSRDELLNMSIPDIEAIERPEDTARHIRKIMESGHDCFETSHRRKDGKIIGIEVNTAYTADGGGRFFGFLKDITERKRAELEYEIIIKGALDCFVILDSKGRFLNVNDAYCDLIGYSRDELLSMGVVDVEAVENQSDIDLHIQKVMETGSDRFETRHRRKDGGFVYIEVSANYRNVGGGRLFSFYRDITERKKADDELRKSREQLRLLAENLQTVREEERKRIARDIHDDLGQVLTALNFDLSCIEEMLDKKQKPVIEKTRQAISLVDTAIDKVQKISWELRPTVLDDLGIAAAVEWQAKEFQSRTGTKCALSFDPAKIVLDKGLTTEIFRVFQEALTNVARHAKATRVEVSMKKTDGKIVMQISDNGRGITKREIEAPESIGLTGMRERVYPWKGEVQITGMPKKGTTVTVTVPVGGKRRKR